MEIAAQRNNIRGFTLVEIMVAMVITLIVMGGVYKAMVDDTVTQIKGEQMLEMQSNARIALERIVRDVRRAGNFGGGGTDSAPNFLKNYSLDPVDAGKIGKYTIATDVGRPGLPWSGQKSILSTLNTLPGVKVDYLGEALGFSNDAVAGIDVYALGTDALSLVYLSDERRVTAINTGAQEITPDLPLTYSADDIMYISDNKNYALFQKTNSDRTQKVAYAYSGLNNPAVLSLGAVGSSGPITRLFKLNIATYFVHKNEAGDFNLCLNDYSHILAANIEDLQFEFLFDDLCEGVACTDGRAGDGEFTDETWQTSLGAHTSKQVRAVRIWVMAMSEPDYSYTDNNKYSYPNSPYVDESPGAQAPIASPKDGEHRHRFLTSAVVYVRNGMLQ